MKILLVDESQTIRNIQKNVLKQLGHEDVVEAGDVREALDALAQHQPDLMLVDWSMPHMDGLALVREVRTTDASLPIIMCSNEAVKSRVVEAIKAGVTDYIVKPFTADSLLEKLERTMAKLA